MHDANGTPLQKGDRVLIPAVITEVSASEELCNVTVRLELRPRPDFGLNDFFRLSTRQVIKFRNEDPEPPIVGDVYFDSQTGMRPEDLHLKTEQDAVTV